MKPVATAKFPLLAAIAVLFIFAPAFSTTKPESADSTRAEESNIKETLVIDWPEGQDWRLDNTMNAEASTVQVYYPRDDGGDGWKEMATIETVYGKTNINLPGMARMTFLGTQKGSPEATWEILDKGYIDDNNKTPYIIYEIICPEFLNGEPPQIQYWKLIAGKTALFNVQYSYRGEEIPKDKKEAILQAFREAHLKIEKKAEDTDAES